MTGSFKQFIIQKIVGHVILIFLLMLIIIIAIWTRTLISSKKNFSEGEKYFNNKQYIKAITFFDRSMHWYTPFNTYIEKSAEYLWEISDRAKAISNDQLSMIAIETIRNSFYSSRSFYLTGDNWIKRCDDRIHDITKNQDEKTKNEEVESGGQDKIYMQDNIVYNDPAILWTVVLEIGLLGWIGAVLGIIFFRLRPSLEADRFIHTYWFWILLAGINYSLWIFGMIKA